MFKIITFRANTNRRQDFGENPRDNKWLKNQLINLKNRYFPDLEIANNLIIKFGRPAKTRLGSIKHGRRRENPNTIITINGHFQDREIPDFVIDATILHELTHYSQGWFSPHPRQHHYPHQGRAVKNELTDRGLSDILMLSRKWLKRNWREYIKQNHGY
ncbi:MAG: hypothetical protein CEN89_571 [Candidatus Berkelbacteria bacterium Licking1014_7]|uniref:SprT-like domain-containing protein n=1 Tax=Candidatus Berkelbacteria bacterium Licking1014_7 TaxID=2017147 RepID=A0A554LIG8_9BACT|nr:MAG: hypothetical protein CEN89_571 [Candidatus Berkelbacteria bacterium Licking1014_7]